ncbi:MAG: LacI family DNA-binding transcriptional regulator [Pseudomonadota bacterium]
MTTAPTLEDVARAAGVSTATVSRCLNMPDRVVEKTRARVMKAVSDLNYTPNFGARVMAAKRTQTIGAIIPTMENAIFARGIQAFQETLHAKGYTLLVASSAYDPALEEQEIKALVARGADGLLLIGQDRDGSVYDYLARQQVPTLLAWTHGADAPCPTAGFDNRAAMRGLAEVVLGKGHRRLGMISAPTATNDRARQRVAGVRDAMAAAGLDANALALVHAPYDIDSASTAFEGLMGQSPRPTVVLCGNDVQAAGAIHQARKMSLAVPEDVSITGFDDMDIAPVLSPPLTTVAVPHRAMGQRAARTLVAMVEGEDMQPDAPLATQVILRASLKALPQAD